MVKYKKVIYKRYMNNKDYIVKKINAYFFLMTLALSISVYLWALDSGATYTSKIDIMLSPKNIKTSVYLGKAKENLVYIFKENININDSVTVITNKSDSLIRLEVDNEKKQLALDLSQENLEKFIGFASKYYDIRNDLEVEIVNRSVVKNRKGFFYLIAVSVISGLILSFVIQIFLDTVDKFISKSKKRIGGKERNTIGKVQADLKSILSFNNEKIKRLSEDTLDEEKFPEEIQEKETIIKNKETDKSNNAENKIADEKVATLLGDRVAIFKRSSSPANLPTASFENENIEKNDSSGFKIEEAEIKNDEGPDMNLSQEPTEEDFKKRLNQLLGNK